MTKTQTGNQGENLACEHLNKLGYKIIERNFRIRGGEIDIIALDKDELVFVEVKTRYSHQFGLPLESITPWKIKFILKAALFYILKVKWGDRPYRLDAVLVDYAEDKNDPKIEVIKNITS
ncbi:MAG: YraN family protein [Candidatus Daviesbacteria bacterium]|nr:YraN family protein [Candidatus Daviesbacteria bacterium]